MRHRLIKIYCKNMFCLFVKKYSTLFQSITSLPAHGQCNAMDITCNWNLQPPSMLFRRSYDFAKLFLTKRSKIEAWQMVSCTFRAIATLGTKGCNTSNKVADVFRPYLHLLL